VFGELYLAKVGRLSSIFKLKSVWCLQNGLTESGIICDYKEPHKTWVLNKVTVS